VNDEMRSRRKYINGRKGKEWLRGGAAGHVLTDMTSRVTVTEGAEADAALGELGDGLEHGGPCVRTEVGKDVETCTVMNWML
jgi:hypothetical protein